MELLFCFILAEMRLAIIFINLPGAKKRFSCLTYIKKPIMSKATRKKHQQPLAPRNTLNNYFSKANTTPKESAKQTFSLLKQQSIGNAETNGSQGPPSLADNYYQNDDSRYQGATNFADVQRLKNAQLEVDYGNSDYSHTNPVANLNKIKLMEHDDESTKIPFKKNVAIAIMEEVTKNHAEQLKNKHQIKQDQKIHKKEVKEYRQKQSDVKLELKANKKVEEILAKQPLRNRFSALLTDDLKYSIGFQHTRLLKLLRCVDRTIQFLRSNRQTSSRGIFFSQLRKLLYENNRTELSFKSLQQLIFIDDGLFAIQWLNNQKQKKFDLNLTAPPIPSQDARIEETRKKIVGFLLIKQAQYLVANNMNKQEDKWSGGFDPNLVQIPCKDLPTHPNMRNAQIGQLSRAQIDAVANPRLRNIIQTVKQTSDARSLCSNDVVSMIFEKKTNTEIKDRLYEQIRLKQERNAILAQAPVQTIDKKMALDICTEIQLIYMSKGMSNIFRETLLDSLNKRLRFKQVSILQCFQFIMSQKEVEFLKEVTMSNKTVIIQINKQKFKEMREKIESSL